MPNLLLPFRTFPKALYGSQFRRGQEGNVPKDCTLAIANKHTKENIPLSVLKKGYVSQLLFINQHNISIFDLMFL